MGTVVPFKLKNAPLLSACELDLLRRLRASLQAMWRGGWAEPGEHGGVVLLRKQHCLGIWSFERGRLVYRPVETGVPEIEAASVEEAFARTLLLLGELAAGQPPPPDPSADS